MFHPKYHELCEGLRAPAGKIEEVIQMTENMNQKKHRNPLKVAGVLAAALALMVVSVSAAAPETVVRVMDWISGTITNHIVVNAYQDQYNLVTEDGSVMTITSLYVPKASVENRDGRAILVVEGEDEVDITDALAADGAYHYEKEVVEGVTMTADVEGSIDHWTIRAGTETADPSSNAGMSVIYSSEDVPTLDDFQMEKVIVG